MWHRDVAKGDEAALATVEEHVAPTGWSRPRSNGQAANRPDATCAAIAPTDDARTRRQQR
jgi:hypothetical protein